MKTVEGKKKKIGDRDHVNIEKFPPGKIFSGSSTDSSIHPVNEEDIKRARRKTVSPARRLSGLDAFRTFLKSEFSEENVEFWLACEDFKKTESAEKLVSKAKVIYSEFIEADAPKEINIDFSTRDLISKNIAEPTRKCFDEAQKLIYSLMAKDSFPRFLKSEIYKELVHSRQVGNHKKWLPFL
uniref:Regulator of G protein signaling 21 n=1 Tax=Sus scrofa TaxID=9823 RepID=A0A8D0PYR1_PIG